MRPAPRRSCARRRDLAHTDMETDRQSSPAQNGIVPKRDTGTTPGRGQSSLTQPSAELRPVDEIAGTASGGVLSRLGSPRSASHIIVENFEAEGSASLGR